MKVIRAVLLLGFLAAAVWSLVRLFDSVRSERARYPQWLDNWRRLNALLRAEGIDLELAEPPKPSSYWSLAPPVAAFVAIIAILFLELLLTP